MRRKDREVTEKNKILEIIDRCDCCRLGFYDGQEVYIVPLSFGYTAMDDGLTLYFHGAREGRKADLINQVKTVGFEMDTNYRLNEAETPCNHSARFDSVIGSGRISMVSDMAERESALQQIMIKATHRSGWKFSEAMLNAVCVFKVEVTKLSCKSHL